MKRVVSLALSLVLFSTAFTMMGAVVKATQVCDDFIYSYVNGSNGSQIKVDGYEGNSDVVEIPSQIEGKPVVGICGFAKRCPANIRRIVIPDSVKSIEDHCFTGLKELNEIVIGRNVDDIWRESFKDTAFYDDSKNWVDGILYIGNYLIRADDTVQGSLVLSDNVRVVAQDAFNGCRDLKSIKLPNNMKQVPNGIFEGCLRLSSVSLPGTISSIGDWSFANCSSLEYIVIPDAVIEIGFRAFNRCTNLKSIKIGDNIQYIGSSAFEDTFFANSSLNWSGGGLYLEYCLIKANSEVQNFVVRDGTRLIADFAFAQLNGVRQVLLPNSLKYINEGAFVSCHDLKSVEIPDSVVELGKYCFDRCFSLESIVFGSGVTEIPTALCRHCSSLTEIVMRDSVEEIGFDSFEDCPSLKEITIPSSVKYISSYAFKDCISLEKVVLEYGVTRLSNSVFEGLDNVKTMVVPDSVTDIYYFGFGDRDSIPKGIKILCHDGSMAYREAVLLGLSYELLPHEFFKVDFSDQHSISYKEGVFGSNVKFAWKSVYSEDLNDVNLIKGRPRRGVSFGASVNGIEVSPTDRVTIDMTIPSVFKDLPFSLYRLQGNVMTRIISYETVDRPLSSNYTIRFTSGSLGTFVVVSDILYGDANGDGSINMLDVLLVRKCIAKQPIKLNSYISDVTDDGNINMLDVLLLRKYIAKQPVTLDK